MIKTLYKGQKIYGPNDRGYEIIEDIGYNAIFHPSCFKAFGGAPEPAPGMKMPDWLVAALESRALG